MLLSLPEQEGKGELLGEAALRWSIPVIILSPHLDAIWCPITSRLQERARRKPVKVSQLPGGASLRNHDHYLRERVDPLESFFSHRLFFHVFV